MSAGPERDHRQPVRVEIRFERGPSAIKGAFVLAGADGNPHAVRFESAELARVPAGPVRPVATEDRVIDVAPSRDLFVPFEVPVGELEPSWYAVRGAVLVDGAGIWEFQGRPFAVPWPRTDVRRGSIVVDRRVRVGSADVRIERVELGGEAAVVVWRRDHGSGDPGSEAEAGEGTPASREPGADVILLADGEPLEPLPAAAVERRGRPVEPDRWRSASYPVPRATNSLSVLIRLSGGEESDPVPVPLG